MSTLNVSLKVPETVFPNFPNACEEIQRMALEMGLQRNIQIMQISSDCASVKHIPKPSDTAILNLHHNFPENCFKGSSVAKEFILRHEIAHMKFEDDSVSSLSSTCLRIFSIVIGFGASAAIVYALKYTGYDSFDVFSIPSIFPSILSCTGVSNLLYVQMHGGRSAYQFREKRADTEACKYLSVEEKIKAITWLKKASGVIDASFYYLSGYPDSHPNSKERIKTIWDSFSEEQKTQYGELKREFSIS